jgi:hypothetical protein
MKKLIFALSIGVSTCVLSQSSIQPSFGLNIWSPAGLSNGISTFLEIGADYEHGVSDQLGINGGISYNFSQNSLNGGFIKVNAGTRYNLNELNDGFFVGGDLGFGFMSGSNVITAGANLGYSIPIGNGSLNPNISLGYMSMGSGGYRFGGLYFPINVSYSICF